jgi:8-oxo-dGTP pyrophosphatase MutT (NUDIX family)
VRTRFASSQLPTNRALCIRGDRNILSVVRQPKTQSAAIGRLPKQRAQLVREQAAAVCYRVNGHGIEFLLIQTRGGRWTFPKGGLEPGLTHAQAAALEAVEEAGVHGRMETFSFARYLACKRSSKRGLGRTQLAINAHLCEVLYLAPPQESKRNRTWFPADKAKRRLCQDRTREDAIELACVLDRAVHRIQNSRPAGETLDALQRVQFEAFDQMAHRNWIGNVGLVPRSWGVDVPKKSVAPSRVTRLKLLPKVCATEVDSSPEPAICKVN